MASGESISPRGRPINPANATMSNFTGTLLPNGDKVPTWSDLPLDAKFPMIPSPKGTVSFHTTKLCERKQISSRKYDFDLTDPNCKFMSNEYEPLHDPHLKTHFSSPVMYSHLLEKGFTTEDNKVTCSIKEFNQYRQYLRKICLMELTRERHEKDLIERTLRQAKCHNTGAGDTHAIKLSEVRKRIREQELNRKRRHQKMFKAEDERYQRKKREHELKMIELEARTKLEEERRRTVLLKHQQEIQRRNNQLLKKWNQRDRMRLLILEERNRQISLRQQARISDGWDTRKQIEKGRQEANSQRSIRDDTQRLLNIEERERRVGKQRHRLNVTLQKLKHASRQRRYEQEEAASRRLQERLAAASLRILARKGVRRARRIGQRFRSLWTVEEVLYRLSISSDSRPASRFGSARFMEMITDTLDEAVDLVMEQETKQEQESLRTALRRIESAGENFEEINEGLSSETDERDLVEFAYDYVHSLLTRVTTEILPSYMSYVEVGGQGESGMLFSDYSSMFNIDGSKRSLDSAASFASDEDSSSDDYESSSGHSRDYSHGHLMTPVPSAVPDDKQCTDYFVDRATLSESNLVEALLRRLLDDLNAGRIARDDLIKLATYSMEILSARDNMESPEPVDRSSDISLVGSQASSTTDDFVRFTLSKILDNIKSGDLTQSEIMALTMSTLGAKARNDEPSDESISSFVVTTLSNIVKDIDEKRLTPDDLNKMAASLTSTVITGSSPGSSGHSLTQVSSLSETAMSAVKCVLSNVMTNLDNDSNVSLISGELVDGVLESAILDVSKQTAEFASTIVGEIMTKAIANKIVQDVLDNALSQVQTPIASSDIVKQTLSLLVNDMDTDKTNRQEVESLATAIVSSYLLIKSDYKLSTGNMVENVVSVVMSQVLDDIHSGDIDEPEAEQIIMSISEDRLLLSNQELIGIDTQTDPVSSIVSLEHAVNNLLLNIEEGKMSEDDKDVIGGFLVNAGKQILGIEEMERTCSTVSLSLSDSSSDKVAEETVNAILSRIKSDISDNRFNADTVHNIAASILQLHSATEFDQKYAEKEEYMESFQDVRKKTSSDAAIAEAIVTETLNNIVLDLVEGAMVPSVMLAIGESLNFLDSPDEHIESYPPVSIALSDHSRELVHKILIDLQQDKVDYLQAKKIFAHILKQYDALSEEACSAHLLDRVSSEDSELVETLIRETLGKITRDIQQELSFTGDSGIGPPAAVLRNIINTLGNTDNTQDENTLTKICVGDISTTSVAAESIVDDALSKIKAETTTEEDHSIKAALSGIDSQMLSDFVQATLQGILTDLHIPSAATDVDSKLQSSINVIKSQSSMLASKIVTNAVERLEGSISAGSMSTESLVNYNRAHSVTRTARRPSNSDATVDSKLDEDGNTLVSVCSTDVGNYVMESIKSTISSMKEESATGLQQPESKQKDAILDALSNVVFGAMNRNLSNEDLDKSDTYIPGYKSESSTEIEAYVLNVLQKILTEQQLNKEKDQTVKSRSTEIIKTNSSVSASLKEAIDDMKRVSVSVMKSQRPTLSPVPSADIQEYLSIVLDDITHDLMSAKSATVLSKSIAKSLTHIAPEVKCSPSNETRKKVDSALITELVETTIKSIIDGLKSKRFSQEQIEVIDLIPCVSTSASRRSIDEIMRKQTPDDVNGVIQDGLKRLSSGSITDDQVIKLGSSILAVHDVIKCSQTNDRISSCINFGQSSVIAQGKGNQILSCMNFSQSSDRPDSTLISEIATEAIQQTINKVKQGKISETEFTELAVVLSKSRKSSDGKKFTEQFISSQNSDDALSIEDYVVNTLDKIILDIQNNGLDERSLPGFASELAFIGKQNSKVSKNDSSSSAASVAINDLVKEVLSQILSNTSATKQASISADKTEEGQSVRINVLEDSSSDDEPEVVLTPAVDGSDDRVNSNTVSSALSSISQKTKDKDRVSPSPNNDGKNSPTREILNLKDDQMLDNVVSNIILPAGETFDESKTVLEDQASDSDSEPEVVITPTVHGSVVHIAQETMSRNLSSLSFKEKSSINNVKSPATRASYRSLINPELEEVPDELMKDNEVAKDEYAEVMKKTSKEKQHVDGQLPEKVISKVLLHNQKPTSLHGTQILEDSASDDDDEIDLIPTIHGSVIHVDPHIMSSKLSSISLKDKDHLFTDIKTPAGRASYRSLVMPELTQVPDELIEDNVTATEEYNEALKTTSVHATPDDNLPDKVISRIILPETVGEKTIVIIEDSDSSEDEFVLTPTVHGSVVHINPETMSKKLSSISIKNKDLLGDIHEPVRRSSYRSLMMPEMEEIPDDLFIEDVNAKEEYIEAVRTSLREIADKDNPLPEKIISKLILTADEERTIDITQNNSNSSWIERKHLSANTNKKTPERTSNKLKSKKQLSELLKQPNAYARTPTKPSNTSDNNSAKKCLDTQKSSFPVAASSLRVYLPSHLQAKRSFASGSTNSTNVQPALIKVSPPKHPSTKPKSQKIRTAKYLNSKDKIKSGSLSNTTSPVSESSLNTDPLDFKGDLPLVKSLCGSHSSLVKIRESAIEVSKKSEQEKSANSSTNDYHRTACTKKQ